MSLRKIGVEEELMLVDPTTGQLTAVSQSAVLANETDEEVEQELFLQQIETSTPPCEKADDLVDGLRAGRRAVGEAAAAAGARAVAMATPVLAEDDEDFTPKSRYRRIQDEYGEMARQALVCAMHMHVDVDLRRGGGPGRRRDPAVAAAARRDGRELALLAGPRHRPRQLALAGVEPLADGRSRPSRSATWRPTARCRSGCSSGAPAWTPGCSTSTSGSPSDYPTVEIRVADVCTDVEDALLVALLTRALVATVAADRSARRPGAATCSGSPAGGPPGTAWPATWCTRSTRPWSRPGRCSTRRWSTAATRWTSTATSTWCVSASSGSSRAGRERPGSAARSRRPAPCAAVVEDLARRTEDSWR